MINILISKRYQETLQNDYEYIVRFIEGLPVRKVYSSGPGKYIMFPEYDLKITFKLADPEYLRGLRPDFVHCDDEEIERYFISTHARIRTFSGIINYIMERFKMFSIYMFLKTYNEYEIRFSKATMANALLIEVIDIANTGGPVFRHMIPEYDITHSNVDFDIIVMAPIINWLDEKEREELRNES